eukprot:NODE_97_length_20652_cov_0.832093.p11 type:complete len:190 gc:universal NODE_97_length_20652_cov_0.832093:1416-847(-)
MLFLKFAFGAISADCANAIQLAYNMNMPQVQPSNWASLSTDCCKDTGRTSCDANGRVNGINWGGGLNGFINFTAFRTLTNLQFFKVDYQSLSGTFPDSLQDSLADINVYANLGGTLHFNASSFKMPKSLTNLNLGYVDIIGSFPKNAFTKNMFYLNVLYCGSLTGSLYFNAIKFIYVYNTQISKIFAAI